MRIKVELVDKNDKPVKGIVQVGDQALWTVEGAATFEVTKGDYAVRGLAQGHHFESKSIKAARKNLSIVIKAR